MRRTEPPRVARWWAEGLIVALSALLTIRYLLGG